MEIRQGRLELRATPPPYRTIAIADECGRGLRIMAEIGTDQRFHLLTAYASLAQAYSPVEASPPDLVICTTAIAAQPEFAMFSALIDVTGGRLVTVRSGDGIADMARALGLRPMPLVPPPSAAVHRAPQRQRLVAIGSSTGGIEALSLILGTYPVDCPPTVIVQHIKPEFLDSVVARLNAVCPANVQTARAEFRLGPGQVVFAPGLPVHLEIEPGGLRCRLQDGPPVSGHRPSVDRLFQSAALLKSNAVGVLLTGMGRDGATGLGAMRRAGAWTIAQDAATSTVYGMPRVAQAEGAVCEVLPLPRICRAILSAATISTEAAS